MGPQQQLVAACAAMALLTFVVGLRMFVVRVREMKVRRISPQSVALSGQRAQRFDDSRASDNYNHLFELPVLFYVLCLTALAIGHIPAWLPLAAWVFVGLRVVHSAIQCSYNRVMHRFAVFVAGFVLLAAMWVGFVISWLPG